MATKLIAYDLNSPGQDYQGLIDAIKSLGTWWHHLDSTWLVKSAMTCTQIRDQLAAHLDEGDELLVVDVTNSTRAWRGFSPRGSTWLKDTWE